MKKSIFLVVLIFFLGVFITPIKAQDVRLGVTFAPTISFNQGTFTANDQADNLAGGASGLRFIFGLISDFNLSDDSYYFSTGLVYLTKTAGLDGSFGGVTDNQYNLQYLQVPLTLKLFTNEVMSGARIFFQLGGGLELKISEKVKTENNPDNEDPIDFQVIDVPLILASGIEFDLGENLLYGSLGYQRGLTNAAKKVDEGKLVIRNQLLTFNVGFFF